MSQPIQAIYENGFLRPLAPLPTPLAEQQVVTVWIQPLAEPSRELSEAQIAENQAAWLRFAAEMEALAESDVNRSDEPVSDEDRLIYGD
jgi:predicted DNA-binding antitoxin AbrB/MazE fold protein